MIWVEVMRRISLSAGILNILSAVVILSIMELGWRRYPREVCEDGDLWLFLT